jgi:putative nucleotidyltransferase with HDIG domain
VEFFKDDTTRKCHHCGHRFVNPKMDFGCASYCEFAEQCIGNLPPELLAGKEDLLKDRVAIEMKRYFKTDFRRIGHATRVARYAERIAKKEVGNMAVVLCAAYLHDIGTPASEHRPPNRASGDQEREGPRVARAILEKLGAKDDLIEEVCDIIGHHHHTRPDDTLNFKILYDANRITNMEERHKETPMDRDRIEKFIQTSLLTESGKEEAQKVFSVS